MWKQVWASLLSVKTISWPAWSSQLVSHGSSCSGSLRAPRRSPPRWGAELLLRNSHLASLDFGPNISELERTSGHLVQTFLQIRGQRPMEGKSPALRPLVGYSATFRTQASWSSLSCRCSVICEFSQSNRSLKWLSKIQVLGTWPRNASVWKAALGTLMVNPIPVCDSYVRSILRSSRAGEIWFLAPCPQCPTGCQCPQSACDGCS